jgi:hypothetical protein
LGLPSEAIRKRAFLVIPGLVLGLLLGSCGDSDNTDADQIREVFANYQQAVQSGDAETICHEVIPPSAVSRGSQKACRSFFSKALRNKPTRSLSNAGLGDIEIDGNRATAQNETNGGFFTFVRENGQWYLQLAH